MAYNPYSAVNAIYKLKGQWNKANSAGDDAAKNSAAEKAQAYYNQLIKNGYQNVASELTDANYEQAEKVRNKWAKMDKTATRPYLYTLGQKYGMSNSDVDKIIGWDSATGQVSIGGKTIGTPDAVVDGASYWSDTSVLDNAFKDYISRSGSTYNTSVNNAAYNQSMTSAINKNNEYFDMVKSDHDKVNSKYDDIFNYANSDVTKSDEYQSAYDNIMPSYTLAAMQGRKSQTASGAASNGGNVDSFSAANALRQQAALTAKGQQLAHQAGLEAYQARIQNARNILSDLGVYNSGVYSAMSDSIGHDRTTANDIINNEETAKNNDVARKSEIASVTGYTPDEWVVSNNPYMNEDGTIKEQYKDVDFSEVMAKAKATGNTAAYNAAATARYYKIMSNYGLYGQYDDGNYNLPTQQQTEAARQFDEQIAAADRALGVEKEMGAAENQNKLDQITTAALYSTDTVDNLPKVSSKSTGSKSSTTGNTANAKTQSYDLLGDDSDADGRDANNDEWDNFMTYFPEEDRNDDRRKIRAFLTEQLKPYFDNGWEINEEVLEKLIVGTDVKNSNSTKYDIDVDEAKAICNALGLDTAWVDKYKDRWGLNSGKGMKSA